MSAVVLTRRACSAATPQLRRLLSCADHGAIQATRPRQQGGVATAVASFSTSRRSRAHDGAEAQHNNAPPHFHAYPLHPASSTTASSTTASSTTTSSDAAPTSSQPRNEPAPPSSLTSGGPTLASASQGPASTARPATARGSRLRAPRKAAMKLTAPAVAQLHRLLARPDPKLIRVGVRNRGCSGLAYHLEYVDRAGAFDETVEQDGVKVLVDSKALFSIIGSEMDWVEDKLSERFVFRNPNIKEQCGCGESFMV